MYHCPRCDRKVRIDTTPGAVFYCPGNYVGNYVGLRCFLIQRWEEKLADRDQLLQEREKTHGSFALNAEYSQRLKVIFLTARSEHAMLDVHREALDMIALKLSRILSGQADFKDHWDDIAGYAKLASEACQRS